MTSFLAAFFLLVSCSSLTCAISCGLKSVAASPRHIEERATSSASQKVAYDHCGHLSGKPSTQAKVLPDQPTVSSNQCVDSLCAHEQPATLTAANDVHLDHAPFVIQTVPAILGLKTVALETNARLPDWLPHAPLKRIQVLRL